MATPGVLTYSTSVETMSVNLLLVVLLKLQSHPTEEFHARAASYFGDVASSAHQRTRDDPRAPASELARTKRGPDAGLQLAQTRTAARAKSPQPAPLHAGLSTSAA